MPELPAANIENVVAIVEHLLRQGSLEGWFATHADTPYVDLFMAVHNFHKQMVDDLARRWFEEQGLTPAWTYKMALDTWYQAMHQRIRDGLPAETITEAHQDAQL